MDKYHGAIVVLVMGLAAAMMLGYVLGASDTIKDCPAWEKREDG